MCHINVVLLGGRDKAHLSPASVEAGDEMRQSWQHPAPGENAGVLLRGGDKPHRNRHYKAMEGNGCTTVLLSQTCFLRLKHWLELAIIRTKGHWILWCTPNIAFSCIPDRGAVPITSRHSPGASPFPSKVWKSCLGWLPTGHVVIKPRVLPVPQEMSVIFGLCFSNKWDFCLLSHTPFPILHMMLGARLDRS